MTFPKRKFLCLRVGEREVHHLSCAYQSFPASCFLPLVDRADVRDDPDYVLLWSWTVLRMHWLALYLSPLSLLLLGLQSPSPAQREEKALGLLFWFTGMGAFLTPGVVDFGPIHEFEYFRWEFAAGFGLAGALALALTLPSRSPRLSSGLAVVILLASWSMGLARFGGALGIARSDGLLRTGSLGASVFSWFLRHQQELRLDPSDLDGFLLLRAEAKAGQTILVNFDPHDPLGIQFESTLVGVTSLVPLGHDYPDPKAPIGLPPCTMNEAAVHFLNSPSATTLARLNPTWLYLRYARDASLWAELESNSELHLRLRIPRGDGRELRIYRCGEGTHQVL